MTLEIVKATLATSRALNATSATTLRMMAPIRAAFSWISIIILPMLPPLLLFFFFLPERWLSQRVKEEWDFIYLLPMSVWGLWPRPKAFWIRTCGRWSSRPASPRSCCPARSPWPWARPASSPSRTSGTNDRHRRGSPWSWSPSPDPRCLAACPGILGHVPENY